MNRTEIISALREAIAILEAGEKPAARPVLERRPAEPFKPAAEEDRRSWRAGTVKYWKVGATQSNRLKARLGIEWQTSAGGKETEYFNVFDPAIIDRVDPLEVDSEVRLVLKPWKDTMVVIELDVVGNPKPAAQDDQPTGTDMDEIPF